jgi:beta-glucanase (GH16 family)
VSNGQLHLEATKSGSEYTSGMVSTGSLTGASQPGYKSFAFKYGYYEVAVRAPAGQGLWAAAWAFGVDLVPPFELDNVEVLGSDPHTAIVTGIFPGGQLSQHLRGPDFSAGFHTFGVDWEPDQVSWYIDGKLAPQTISDPGEIPDKPMFLMIDLAVGGEWPGPPNSRTPFPASLDIDYVRVLQRG